MVHLTKSFIISAIAIAPTLAVPLQFTQDEIDLMARDPSFFGKLRSIVRKVAPVAAMIPGPIGAVGSVASAVTRRELEDTLSTRAVEDDIDLMARDPSFFGKLRSVVRKVAPVAAMIPGPIGAVGRVASAISRRELEDALYTRAVQDELNARGYDIKLGIREVEGLEARDLSEALEARDNIYTLAARQFIDTMEMEARRELSDELKTRQLAPSLDELD